VLARVRERGIEVTLTDEARTLLGNLGYDPTYGARPLKRVIQKNLVDRLALGILEGTFREGDTSGHRRGRADVRAGRDRDVRCMTVSGLADEWSRDRLPVHWLRLWSMDRLPVHSLRSPSLPRCS
jgi:hypothetical protein